MKQILKCAAVITAAIAVVSLTGCNKEEDRYVAYGNGGDTYVIFAGSGSTDKTISASTEGYIGANYQASSTYDMYTNAKEWKIVPDYSECLRTDIEWVKVWPNEGNGDGRFTISFDANSVQGEPRYSNVNIVSNGNVIETIRVAQAAAQIVTLEVMTVFRNLTFYSNDSRVRSIPVNANVFWSYSIPEDGSADWITISDPTTSKFDISVAPNNTGEQRRANITVYQVSNPNNYTTISVTQLVETEEEAAE